MEHEQKEDSGHKNEKKKVDVTAEIKALLVNVRKRDGGKKEFVEAVEEIVHSLEPLFERDPSYIQLAERFLEPERVIRFRVAWVDDSGKTQVNRGYRIQYSSAYGPYKGGLRFHPSVNSGIFEFLALEQALKNALTGIHMGGAKGGSDFDPKGKSESEIMRFCQHFMMELHNYIGEHRDIPAGDQGVGAREIGYLFGAYRKISGEYQAGAITGKQIICGGSYLRPEATGYGIVFIAEEALKELKKTSLKGKRCAVSGSGNVALHCAQKLIAEGGIPITMSDSSGYVLEPDGFTKEQLEHLVQIKEVDRGRIKDYLKFSKSAKYVENAKPWNCDSKYDYAIPCATQHEIDDEDVKAMLERGCQGVFEGSNMPCTAEAITLIKNKQLLFIPAKACNAGGVAASGLEMAQASTRTQWSEKEVEEKLREIMKNILKQCIDTAKAYGRPEDLQFGANVAAFIKVADAMRYQGVL